MPRSCVIKAGRWSVRFLSGRSTLDEIFTLKQIFEKSWMYGKDLFAYLVDLPMRTKKKKFSRAVDLFERGEIMFQLAIR